MTDKKPNDKLDSLFEAEYKFIDVMATMAAMTGGVLMLNSGPIARLVGAATGQEALAIRLLEFLRSEGYSETTLDDLIHDARAETVDRSIAEVAKQGHDTSLVRDLQDGRDEAVKANIDAGIHLVRDFFTGAVEGYERQRDEIDFAGLTDVEGARLQ